MHNLKTVPIFIISFNRPRYLSLLIDWLERYGFSNIIIIDNASTYPPLLEYLARSPHQVHRLPENLGHLALWRSGKFDEVINNEIFVLSDCDVLPEPDCPNDFMEVFRDILIATENVTKVGFSLRIDDLPDHYALRSKVVAHESSFWREVREDGHYCADIDTTFALYRPRVSPSDPHWYRAVRTSPPYTARHLPWYENSYKLDKEEIFYRTHALFSTHWTFHSFRAEFPDATSPSTCDYWLGSLFELLQPNHIIDIGAGSGKIGQIVRAAQRRTPFETHLACIEKNADYVDLFSLDAVYDNIQVRDAIELTDETDFITDLAILSHVICYMQKSRALDLIHYLYFRAGYVCLVFPDPKNIELRTSKKRSVWTPDDFHHFNTVHHIWSGEHIVLIRGIRPSRMIISG